MRLALAFCLLFVACATPSRFAPEPRDPPDNYVASTVETAVLGEVAEDSVTPIRLQLSFHPREFTLVLTSPGGSVYAGWDLIESMLEARAAGTKITCLVPRYAASMAAVILQACDVRLLGRQASLMFHTVSITYAEGTAYDLERLAKEMRAVSRRIAIFVVGRSRMSFAAYEAATDDRDYWLGHEEALALGFIDGVL